MCFTTLLYLDTSKATDKDCEEIYKSLLPSFNVDFNRFRTFTALVTHLYTLNKYTYNSENEHISNDGPQYDVFYPVVVILNSSNHCGQEKSGVSSMELQDKMYFLSTAFHPLNVTVRETSNLSYTALHYFNRCSQGHLRKVSKSRGLDRSFVKCPHRGPHNA